MAIVDSMADRSDEEWEKKLRCREKMYRYILAISKEYKNLFLEHDILKKVAEEKDDRIKKLEHEVENLKKSLTDLQTSLTIKVCEAEQRLQEKERECSNRVKENEKLQQVLEEEKDKVTALSEENNRHKDEVTYHKRTIETLMAEGEERDEKNQANVNIFNGKIQDLEDTMQNSKLSLKATVEYLLRFGDGLIQMDCLTETEDLEAVNFYRSVHDDFEKFTEKENFNLYSQIPSPPLDAITPQLTSTMFKVDAITSPFHQKSPIPIVESPVSSFSNVTTKEKDRPAYSSSSSESECELSHLDFPKDKLSPLPSSPVHVKQLKKDSRFSINFDNPDSPGATSNQRKLGQKDRHVTKLPFSSKRPRISHQPSLGFEPITASSSDAQDNKTKRSASIATPKFTLSQDEENPELLMSFPVTPYLKQQSVNLHFQDDQIMVGYRQIRNRDRSPIITSPIKDQKNRSTGMDDGDGPSDRIHKRTRHKSMPGRELNSSQKASNLWQMHQANESFHCTLSSACASVRKDTNFEEETNASPGKIVEEDSLPQESDTDAEMASIDARRGCDVPKDDPCTEVIKALEKLELLTTEKYLQKGLTDKLKAALSKIVDEKQMENTVNYTISFLCCRISTPLEDYSRNKEESSLYPIDELCIIKAFNMVSNSTLLNQLEEAIRAKIMIRDDTLSLPALAALCRVCSSLQALESRVGDTRLLCCDLLKKNWDISPYLVACIISVWPEALKNCPTNVARSEDLISLSLSYLLTNKPAGLNTVLWDQSEVIFTDYYDPSTVQKPETIAGLIIKEVVANSRPEFFADAEVFNYVTALELLACRHDWSWIHQNILKDGIFHILASYVASVRRKTSGAVGLFYKLVGVLALGRDKDGVCLEFVKETVAKTLGRSDRVPHFILKYAYQVQYNLQLQHTNEADENLENWFRNHGLLIEEMRDI